MMLNVHIAHPTLFMFAFQMCASVPATVTPSEFINVHTIRHMVSYVYAFVHYSEFDRAERNRNEIFSRICEMHIGVSWCIFASHFTIHNHSRTRLHHFRITYKSDRVFHIRTIIENARAKPGNEPTMAMQAK